MRSGGLKEVQEEDVMSVPVKKCALVGSLAASLLAVSGAGPGSDADAQDRYNRWVRIHNNTSLVLREFYASNTGEPRWQEDILVVSHLIL
jgi:hypothetical protein